MPTVFSARPKTGSPITGRAWCRSSRPVPMIRKRLRACSGHSRTMACSAPATGASVPTFGFYPAADRDDLELWLSEQAYRYCRASADRPDSPADWRRALDILDRVAASRSIDAFAALDAPPECQAEVNSDAIRHREPARSQPRNRTGLAQCLSGGRRRRMRPKSFCREHEPATHARRRGAFPRSNTTARSLSSSRIPTGHIIESPPFRIPRAVLPRRPCTSKSVSTAGPITPHFAGKRRVSGLARTISGVRSRSATGRWTALPSWPSCSGLARSFAWHQDNLTVSPRTSAISRC